MVAPKKRTFAEGTTVDRHHSEKMGAGFCADFDVSYITANVPKRSERVMYDYFTS